ncbi:MAG: DUF3696 domain-containing protein, partial [Flavobacteriales bacterium]
LVHGHKLGQHVHVALKVSREGSQPANVEIDYAHDGLHQPKLSSLTVHLADDRVMEIRRGKGAGGPYVLSVNGKAQGGEQAANFSFPVHGLFPIVGDERPKKGRPTASKALRREARALFADIEDILRSLSPLGAFREMPRRGYELGGFNRSVSDTTGRYVVQALLDDFTRRGKARKQLWRGVNLWLKDVARVQLLPIKLPGKGSRSFELRLKDINTGQWANFADVGSGIGQAFPVIVEGLRTPEGGTFLVQEPEIHLHPDAQLQMGQFLFDLAQSGRRVIAETHSEHLLLRVRRLIVESKGRLSSDDVSILFVDHDQSGAATVKALNMDEMGQILNWPAGFMEDASNERMTLLKAIASKH